MNAKSFIKSSTFDTLMSSIIDLENSNLPIDYFTSVLPRAQYGDESAVPIGLNNSDATLIVNDASDSSKGVLFGSSSYYTADSLQKANVAPTPSHGSYASQVRTSSTGSILVGFSGSLTAADSSLKISALRSATALQKYKEIQNSNDPDFAAQVLAHFGIKPKVDTRTSIFIGGDDASLNYVEGCTAPQYSEDSLHAAVVEIFVGKRAKCRYSTIQNWSTNILNLVTQRAQVEEDGLMEWVDGNVGSGTNMKYPCCVLKGDRAKGSCISIAVAGKNQFQDAGAKMIHIGKNTSSTIISKSIVKEGGRANYRGLAKINKNASHSNSHIECDTLMLDEKSFSDTIPENIVNNNSSFIEHEASVSKLDEGKMFYLMSRGLSEKDAKHLLVMGFIEPFSKELPMEYAVELNQLIKLDMEGSIG